MPHRLNVFFLHFLMKFNLLHLVFFYHFVLNILYYRSYDTDMKAPLHAGDMDLNRKDKKKYVEMQNCEFIFLFKSKCFIAQWVI